MSAMIILASALNFFMSEVYAIIVTKFSQTRNKFLPKLLTSFAPYQSFVGRYEIRDQTKGGEWKMPVRINCCIDGEAARILLDMKKRGIVKSNREAVVQGLFSLYEKVMERDLQLARLKTLKGVEE